MNANPFHSDWQDNTVLHPVGLAAVLVLGVAVLLVRRQHAVVPLLIMSCLISPAQRVVIASLDFDLLRIMVVFGWVRILMRSEWRGLRWCAADWSMALWAGLGVLTWSLTFPSRMTYILGYTFDIVGMYFLFRALVRTMADVTTIATAFALIAIPVAMLFAVEQSTGRNLFAALGGVREFTEMREGRLRCQGAFAHPILAGCYWTATVPLMGALWWAGGRKRMLGVVGTVAAFAIIALCASSTPIMGLLFVALGAVMFVARRWMPVIRWGLLFAVIGLHLVMKAPVWHLVSRVDVIGGSTGYHRFVLIDAFINRAQEWWVMGSSIGTAHWGYGTVDVTNHYIVQGLRGGIVLLALFIATIAFGFRGVGKLWRNVAHDRARLAMAWAMGVALLVHAVSFMSVTYFGQIVMVWYMLLGMIASVSQASRPAGVAVPRRSSTGAATPTRRRPAPAPAAAAAPAAMRRLPPGDDPMLAVAERWAT